MTFVSFNELCFRASQRKKSKETFVYLDRFQDMMDERTLFARQVLLKLSKTFVLVIIKYETRQYKMQTADCRLTADHCFQG